MAKLDDKVIVFLKKGIPVGFCAPGYEDKWKNSTEYRGPRPREYDSTLETTEAKNLAYLSAKRETIEQQQEAIKLLY